MKTKINKCLTKLLTSFLNPHNDPLKAAAFTFAIADEMSGQVDKMRDNSKGELLRLTGTTQAAGEYNILADAGVSVTLRVSKGATRLDAKKLPATIMELGWMNKNGKPLLLDDIVVMIEHASNTSKPSNTLLTSIPVA